MDLTKLVLGGRVLDVDRDGRRRVLRRVHTPLVGPNGQVYDEEKFGRLNEKAIEATKDEDIDGLVYIPDPDPIPED